MAPRLARDRDAPLIAFEAAPPRATSARVTHLVEDETGAVVELRGPLMQATSDAMLELTEHRGGRWTRLDAESA